MRTRRHGSRTEAAGALIPFQRKSVDATNATLRANEAVEKPCIHLGALERAKQLVGSWGVARIGHAYLEQTSASAMISGHQSHRVANPEEHTRTVTHAAVFAIMYGVAVLSLHVRAVPTGLARLTGYRKPKG